MRPLAFSFLNIFAGALLALVYCSVSLWAKDAQSYVEDAQAYVEKGDLKAAEIQLRNAARGAPQDAHVHALLGQVYLRLGEFRAAEREARSARELNGDEADYLVTLAEALK